MRITKFGHCCLLIEEQEARILIDPGSYTTQQNQLKDIDVILITHEHPDHFHIDSLKTVLANNPQAKVFTNHGVGALLEKAGITFNLLEGGHSVTEKGILIEAIGTDHAVIYPSLPVAPNTGYRIAERFFYPGDAFTKPNVPVEILALPIAGPWLTLAQALDYALELKPKACFPVHDGILKEPGPVFFLPPKILEPQGIVFEVLELDQEHEF